MRYHESNSDSRRGQIRTEFISNFDYGEGCEYSLFDQAQACTTWMRSIWDKILQESET